MNKEKMLMALQKLNDKLKENNQDGTATIFGGTVMCLVFNSRQQTHDIDGIFAPTTEMRHHIASVAQELDLPNDWFNDGVKGFVSQNNDVIEFKRYSNLIIYAATAEYMFAMKSLSARLDHNAEIGDLKFLIKMIGIKNKEQAFEIIEKFYPTSRILPKTAYLLEELIGENRE